MHGAMYKSRCNNSSCTQCRHLLFTQTEQNTEKCKIPPIFFSQYSKKKLKGWWSKDRVGRVTVNKWHVFYYYIFLPNTLMLLIISNGLVQSWTWWLHIFNKHQNMLTLVLSWCGTIVYLLLAFLHNDNLFLKGVCFILIIEECYKNKF